MKKILTAFLMAVLGACLLSAVSIRDITSRFPAGRLESYLTGEVIEMYSVHGDDLASIACDGTLALQKALEDCSDPDSFSQGLAVFVPYPESWGSLSSDEIRMKTMNMLTSISTIKGITYISYSAGDKPVVLFEDAYTLDSSGKKKTADTIFKYAPDQYELSTKAYLKDNRFGGNTYSVDYRISGNEIFMKMTNLSALKLLLFKAVDAGELDMCMDVVLTDEGFALFGMATVYNRPTAVNAVVTTVDLPSAFMRRITALKDWFLQEVSR